MRSIPISIASLRVLALGLAVPLAAQQGPCDQIITACTNAGFTVGGVSTGTGLHVDCVVPIMQGVAQPVAAKLPLPQVNPGVVAACKAAHPDFGQGQASTSAALTQPSGAGQPLATPVSPSTSGSVVTSGNGIPTATGSLSAGAGSVQSGIPSPQAIQPDVKQAPTSGTNGKAATNGNPIASANSSLTVAAGAPQPGTVSGASTRAHGSWPMTCQIGTANGVAVWVPPAASLATITIQASNGPASSGLKPGQCAFEDRGLMTSEPRLLCVHAKLATASFEGGRAIGLEFNGLSGPANTLLVNAVQGPTALMNFMVHAGTAPATGESCWFIDKYGP